PGQTAAAQRTVAAQQSPPEGKPVGRGSSLEGSIERACLSPHGTAAQGKSWGAFLTERGDQARGGPRDPRPYASENGCATAIGAGAASATIGSGSSAGGATALQLVFECSRQARQGGT